MSASDEAVERVRRICLALPEAWEKAAWGEPTWRAKRVFAMFANDHHGDGRVAVWLPAPVGVQELLVRGDPATFFVPPYVGPGGWVGVVVDRCDDAALRELIEQAYATVATKKLLAALDRSKVGSHPAPDGG